MAAVCGLLRRLRVTADYKGFYYTACAVTLCMERPDRLLLVTKWLYPEVAKRYATNWKAVERDIRTVNGIIWRESRPLLEQMSHASLTGKPCAAQLLGILTEAALELRKERDEG